MTKQWLRSLYVMTLSPLAIAGCASGGSQFAPTEPAVETAETNTTPIPASTPQPAFELTRTFYFDYDRAVISEDDLAVLEMHATYLRANPNRNIVVEGHCDERGTRDYNLALGERRSDAVRSFLTSAGVSPRQIENVSYGEERPGAAGSSESAWSRSRRAEMVYR